MTEIFLKHLFDILLIFVTNQLGVYFRIKKAYLIHSCYWLRRKHIRYIFLRA